MYRSELFYNLRSVSQSVGPSWRRVTFGTHDQMLICRQTITGLVVIVRPPWREDGSVCYNSSCLCPLSGVTTQKIKLFTNRTIY